MARVHGILKHPSSYHVYGNHSKTSLSLATIRGFKKVGHLSLKYFYVTVNHEDRCDSSELSGTLTWAGFAPKCKQFMYTSTLTLSTIQYDE